LISPKT